MARGNPTNIALGPGKLYVAPLLTPIPADLDVAWDAGWTALGYTIEGNTQTYAPSYDDVDVAEELDVIDSVPTGREITVAFGLAEMTARNLKLAMNGGTVVFTAAAGGKKAFTTFTPPALGQELYTMIGFEAEDGLERIAWKQCKQTGSVETTRRKGADKAAIPCEFRVFTPADASVPFIRRSGRGTDGAA